MWRYGKWTCDLISESPPTIGHHPNKFGASSSCGSGDVTFLISHVTCDHVVKGHITLRVGSIHPSHYCAKFDVPPHFG